MKIGWPTKQDLQIYDMQDSKNSHDYMAHLRDCAYADVIRLGGSPVASVKRRLEWVYRHRCAGNTTAVY